MFSLSNIKILIYFNNYIRFPVDKNYNLVFSSKYSIGISSLTNKIRF